MRVSELILNNIGLMLGLGAMAFLVIRGLKVNARMHGKDSSTSKSKSSTSSNTANSTNAKPTNEVK